MSAARELSSFPHEVFDSPVLRELDPLSREAIIAAATVRDFEADKVLYEDGDVSESFFVVLSGSIELQTTRRGEDARSTIRVARVGDTFGEEATLPGLARRARATATTMGAVVEVPIAVFRRAMGRSGGHEAEREKRYLHRSVTRDIVHSSALGRGLEEEYLDVLLDAAELRRIARGTHIYNAGDSAEAFYLIAEGLVQLQLDQDSRISVQAYVSRGDFFGDKEIAECRPRGTDAVACGDTWCIRIPAESFRYVAQNNTQVLARLRRVADDSEMRPPAAKQGFDDLYRLKTARSLLVIDQDSCVRCGHCAWSCSEVHGDSRLVRRGDTVRVSLGHSDAAPSTLSMPNTCQHCRNAACMVDCPTGAIGRDIRGEVFIREELCTGCGSCAKACPWENISIAPRSGTLSLSPTVAVKCDLCRGYEAPACVQGCPTESIFRVDPERDIADIRTLLRTSDAKSPATRPSVREISVQSVLVALLLVASIGLTGVGFAMQRTGAWYPSSTVGTLAAACAGVCMVLLAGYAIPKRMVRLWMRKVDTSMVRVPRSRIRPLLTMHVVVGVLACAAAVVHAGVRLPSSPAGALNLAFWISVATGGLGGLLYFFAPKRLTRLERSSTLPEDLVGCRQTLLDDLYRQSSGREELVKAITAKVLVPYARMPLGSLWLLASGRTIAEERAHLRARIDRMLESRGADRLAGLEQLIEIVVDLRAVPSRRVLSASLRGWLPIHIVAAAMASVLLAVHIALVLLW